MKKGKEKLLFITASLSLVLSAGAIVIAANAPLGFNPFVARAVETEYSISFTRANEYSESGTTYAYLNQTQSGNDMYLVSTGGNNRVSGAIATIPSMYDSSVSSPVLKFYKDSEAQHVFRHQSINSITIKTSAAITLNIMTSSDGYAFKSRGTLDCTSTGATFSDFTNLDRFVAVTEDARAASARSIKEVSISYACQEESEPVVQNEYRSVVKDKSDRDSAIRIVFNSDHYGFYKFHYATDDTDYTTLFTWEYDADKAAIKVLYTSTPGGSISGETASGGTTQYQGYCLFARNNSSYGFYNYVSVYDGKISLFYHTQTDSSYTKPDEYYTHNVRSEATLLTPYN